MSEPFWEPLAAAPVAGIPQPVVNGQWIKGVGGAAVWASITTADLPPLPPLATYGTSLPASPSDGAEHVLVDSVTAPTYQWRFRYNASNASAYKWEFIGGCPALAEVAASETTSSTAYVDLATVGPQLVVPRAGVYQVSGGVGYASLNGTANYWVSVKQGAFAAGDTSVVIRGVNVGGGGSTLGAARVQRLTPATSDVVRLQYRVDAGTGTFAMRSLSLIPVAVA